MNSHQILAKNGSILMPKHGPNKAICNPKHFLITLHYGKAYK